MSGLSPVQADKPWYISFMLVITLLNMKYFVLKYAISGKVGKVEDIHNENFMHVQLTKRIVSSV